MLFDKYCHCEILYLVFFSWLPNWVFTLTAYSYIAIYTADLHGFYFHLIYRVLCNFYVIRHWPEGYRTCNNFLKNFVIALTIQTKLIVTDYAKLDISQILHRIIKLIPQHHLHQPSGHPPSSNISIWRKTLESICLPNWLNIEQGGVRQLMRQYYTMRQTKLWLATIQHS